MATVVTWVCVVAFGLLGLATVFAPNAHRGLVRWVHAGMKTRIIGFLLVLAGMLLFALAYETASPLIVRSLGALGFLLGGAQMVIPTIVIVLGEWISSWSNTLLRVYGLILVGVAWLFYRALPVTVEIVEVVESVANGETPAI
jgi:hypothetical protein